MSETPDISVVMPVFNGARWISEQLEALASQRTSLPWELVVADNGSTDATADIVRQFAQVAPCPVTLADASRVRGVSHARNVGVQAARGRAVAFCDCDDRADPSWVEAAAEGTRRHDVIAGLNRELLTPHRQDSRIVNPDVVLRGRRFNAFIGCNFAVDRATYLDLGGFNEGLPPYGCDDVEFALRAFNAGKTVHAWPEMVMYFRRTVGAKRAIRKTYLSAVAEGVLWIQHAEDFPGQAGIRSTMTSLVQAPWHMLRGVANGERSSWPRVAVTRVGNLAGAIAVRRGTYPSKPRLPSKLHEEA